MVSYNDTQAWIGDVTEVTLGPIEWGDSEEGQFMRRIRVKTRQDRVFTLIVRGHRKKALNLRSEKAESDWLTPKLYKG